MLASSRTPVSQDSSQPLLVVIDGPAGAGKTTVARGLAERLRLPLLDTGAIYRTLALQAHRRGVSWDDEEGLAALCRDFPISFSELTPEQPQRVTFDGQDVTAAIRTPEISEGASQVSAHPAVRRALLSIQREQGAKGCVAEGRDMGTVVFPDAPFKFFVTADLQTRAKRRLQELRERGADREELAEVERAMVARDTRDSSRAAAPLAKAPDAIEVDTTDLDVEAVLGRLLTIIAKPRPS